MIQYRYKKGDIDYIWLGAYIVTNIKNNTSVLKESLSYLTRLSFKPVGAIGCVRVDDKIDGVSFALVRADLYLRDEYR